MFVGTRQELFLAFFRFLFRLFRSFLIVGCLVELVCDHDDAVMFHAILVNPFFGFEVALHCEQGTLGDLGKRIGVGVVALGFHVDESGHTLRFFAALLLRLTANEKRATLAFAN